MIESKTGIAHKVCATCACAARMLPDGTVMASDDTNAAAQLVCRRSPPGARYVAAEEPIHRNGEVLTDRDGRVRTRPVQKLQIGYPPTAADAVCWDGWRPIGTEPGIRTEFDRYS